MYCILNCICYVQHLCICLDNGSNVYLPVNLLAFNFIMIFIVSVFMFQSFFAKCCRFLSFDTISGVRLLMESFFFPMLVIIIASSLKNSQTFFIQSSPLYISCIFSIPSNVYILGIEHPQGICLPTFVADDFLGLFLHPSVFLIKDLRSV